MTDRAVLIYARFLSSIDQVTDWHEHLDLVYIALNLLKAFIHFDTLSFKETVAVCLCIDALSSSIMMTLSDKIALASRMYTRTSSVIQLVSLAVMVIALSRKTNTLISTDCCDTMNCWGTTSSCGKLSATTSHYLTARFITSLHGTLLAIRQTAEFDKAKKMHDGRRSLGSEESQSGSDAAKNVHGASPLKGAKDDQSGFERLPASAFSLCWAFLPSIFVSCASLQQLLHHVEAGNIYDWGQSAAVITALTGILH
jgi:hypothetical protein